MNHPDTTRSPSPFRDDYIPQLIGRIRRLVSTSKAQDRQDDTALLQDLIIRLRLWKNDLAIHSESFAQYQLENAGMTWLLKDQIKKIARKIQEMETMSENESNTESWDPMRDLEALMDELMDISGPVAVAVQIIGGTGTTGELIRSIRAASMNKITQPADKLKGRTVAAPLSEPVMSLYGQWEKNNVELVMQNQGKYEAAEKMNKQALEGREMALGKERPDTLASLSNLVSVLQDQGKYKAAEKMNQQALEGREKALGKEHPDTLPSMSNLALLLQDQGKYKEAEKMNQQALEGKEKVLGKEHPNTLASMSNLALVLQNQGKYDQAEDVHRQVLERSEKALGKEHPNTLITVYNLAYLLHQRQQYKDASSLYQRAYTGFQENLGIDHPTTQACLSNYSSLKRVWTLPASGNTSNASISVRRHTLTGPVGSSIPSGTQQNEPVSRRHKLLKKLGLKRV